jgi:hypothetical protein
MHLGLLNSSSSVDKLYESKDDLLNAMAFAAGKKLLC